MNRLIFTQSASGNLGVEIWRIGPDTRPWIIRLLSRLWYIVSGRCRRDRKKAAEAKRAVLLAVEETKRSMLHTASEAQGLLESIYRYGQKREPHSWYYDRHQNRRVK